MHFHRYQQCCVQNILYEDDELQLTIVLRYSLVDRKWSRAIRRVETREKTDRMIKITHLIEISSLTRSSRRYVIDRLAAMDTLSVSGVRLVTTHRHSIVHFGGQLTSMTSNNICLLNSLYLSQVCAYLVSNYCMVLKSVWTTMRLNWAFLNILGQFGRPFDALGAFRLFSYSFPTIFCHNRLIEKRVTDGRTDGRTDGWAYRRTDERTLF